MINLSTLNAPQLEAVLHSDGPLLVLAGAGSGKTRVITYRIARLIEDGIPPESIVGVTFTNKAASEMRERVGKLVDRQRAGKVVLSTFHSLCCRILRLDIEPLGWGKDFTIFSESDQMTLLRSVIPRDEAKTLKLDPRAVQSAISDAKNRYVSPDDWRGRARTPIDEFNSDMYGRYQEALHAQNAVDFDDLIALVLTLFRKHPEVLERYRSRWKYFHIDEYQDTNDAQFQLIRFLAGSDRNLCAVGDDDQSIYAWRGAKAEHILGFEKQFKGATVVKMEQNYRSAPAILHASNHVITNNTSRYDKALWTDKPDGKPVTVFKADDGDAEARAVIQSIQAHHAAGRRYGEFAVLYRTNQQSKPFEEECLMYRIPYVVIGGQQYFDRKEVKDILAYLKVIANPRDAVSLRRIINTPRRGIGNTALARLNEAARERKSTLWDAVAHAGDLPDLPERAAQACESFAALCRKYRERLLTGKRMDAHTLDLIQEIDYWNECVQSSRTVKGAQQKLEFAEEVAASLGNYARETENPTLVEFLERMTLVEDRDDEDPEQKAAASVVKLMTLHSAKGLEFPFVYLTGLEEQLLPHSRSTSSSADVAEERRLFYVGMTRAQEQLVITYAARRRRHGKDDPSTPSRFLKELPRDAQVKRLDE